MRYIVSGGQMKEIDRYTIHEIGIPSMVLMERAAMAVADEIEQRAGYSDVIWAVCGTGNNGADGVAAARMLHVKGYSVSVILAGERDRGSREFQEQLAIADKLGVEIALYDDYIPGRCDFVIDAVFGVGLDREIGGTSRALLTMVSNQKPRFTVAVDLPSGIHADTGAVMGIALPADITVTFGYEKLGTMLYPGKGYSGQVKIADIGFPDISLKRIEPEYFTYECSDKKLIPTRPSYSNKGTFGKVLVIAGSENMSGAAYLSALAAYRTGAGLVKLFTVEENRTVLQTQLPEAIITTYQREEVLAMTDDFKALLEEQCQWADVIVLGPGIGQEPYVENLTEAVLEGAFVPIIIDADGLNAIANNPQLTNYFTENMIITPHLGEMARLTGSSVTNIQKNLITTAREYADRFGITCVLKDAVTIAADKDQKTYVNASGNSSMAKAGSGDVLTGIIAGLLALGLEEEKAASLGVWLHGLAGDKVREVNGEHSLLARELAEAIPVIMQQNNRKEEER